MADVTWSIEVELNHQGIESDDVDTLMEDLIKTHPAIGTAPSGNLSVRIMVDAPTAYVAFDLGTARVRDAARKSGFSDVVLAVELVTEDELDRRLASDN